ncbi:MAG: FkbM family methyltransferase [Rhizobiaceae bacterium]|nr:FkbM family methyltransferase [Rhizobiaceae bacterium]
MFVAATDTDVGRSLVEYGEWSQSEITLLEQLIRPGATALDVGANVGYHTLALSKAVGPTGRVVSFEPQPGIFQLLSANVAINQLSNVTALNVALGEKRGFVDIPPYTYENPGNFGALRLQKMLREENAEIVYTPISVQRLDDIALAQNASVIKMDVEGMELSILQGAPKLLSKNRPAMLLENNDRGESSEKLLNFLMSMEYECFWQYSKIYSRENYRQNPINRFAEFGSFNNLAIPREFVGRVEGLQKVQSISEHPSAITLRR